MSRSAILKRLQAIEQVVERRRAADVYRPRSEWPSWLVQYQADWNAAAAKSGNRYEYFLNNPPIHSVPLKSEHRHLLAQPEKFYSLILEGLKNA